MILRFKTLFGVLALVSLFSCGGGGSISRDDDDTTTDTDTDVSVTTTIELTLTDANGDVSSELAEGTPLTLTALVYDSNGDPVTDSLITYSFQPEGLAEFGNDAGTASTNSNGVATIEILVGASSGAGLITALLDSGETETTTYNSTGTTQVSEQPASLDLYASAIQLASSGTDEIELIALVKDANNVLLEGIDVTFSADSGASLQITQGTTEADGTARATLTTQNNQENRTIVVSAQSSVFSESIDIDVVGTEVNVDAASSAIIDAPVTVTISLVDSDGNGIENEPVTVSTINGVVSATSVTTNTSGQASVQYSGSVSGTDTVTATALNAEGSFDIVIQEDDFSFTALPAREVTLNEQVTLTLTWLKDSEAFAGGTVSFTTSRGNIIASDSITDANGQVTVTLGSDNAGFASLSATGVDDDGNQVSASTEVEFIAAEANSIIVDASPDSVGPDGETSTITAVVRDEEGNLVKGKVVNFLVDDVSGGNISVNQATTDSSGIATTVYTSNAVSTFEAVKVYATVDGSSPEVSEFVSLTVGNRAFDISIGTGRLIEIPTDSSYSKEFSIFVTDPNSNPVENVDLSFSATPQSFSSGGVYRKGYWEFDEDQDVWYSIVTATCDNEDINGNGLLDEGEDENGDEQLTPGNVASIPATGLTDENGQMLIDVSYAKQFGAWVDITIAVNGESAGSEASETQNFSLTVASSDLTDETSPPPNSPYGTGVNCNDVN